MKPENTIFLRILSMNGYLKNHINTIYLICAILASLVLWVSAKVQVPFYPVPLTLQTMLVLIIGGVFGVRLGLLTLSFYMLQGVAGLPVFAGTPEKGLGLVYIFGPTGGYLLGFFLAIIVMGIFSSKNTYQNYWTSLLVLITANLSIYIPGIIWLSRFTGWQKVLQYGFYPFVLGDLFKIFLASIIISAILNKIKPLN